MPHSDDDVDVGSLPEDVREAKPILDLTLVSFEPVTRGNGQNVEEKKAKLRKAILSQISPEDLARVKAQLDGKLVSLSVLFYLWKGKAEASNTRPVKELDNLLKVLFDVLRRGEQGVEVIA